MKLLLAKGADPLGETFDGSPLEMAEQKEAVRLLEDHLEVKLHADTSTCDVAKF